MMFSALPKILSRSGIWFWLEDGDPSNKGSPAYWEARSWVSGTISEAVYDGVHITRKTFGTTNENKFQMWLLDYTNSMDIDNIFQSIEIFIYAINRQIVSNFYFKDGSHQVIHNDRQGNETLNYTVEPFTPINVPDLPEDISEKSDNHTDCDPFDGKDVYWRYGWYKTVID